MPGNVLNGTAPTSSAIKIHTKDPNDLFGLVSLGVKTEIAHILPKGNKSVTCSRNGVVPVDSEANGNALFRCIVNLNLGIQKRAAEKVVRESYFGFVKKSERAGLIPRKTLVNVSGISTASKYIQSLSMLEHVRNWKVDETC